MKISLFLSMFFSSCSVQKDRSRWINITSDITKEQLNNATLEPVTRFIERRMNNQKMEKVAGKRCEVLSATDDFVFYGFPIATPDETGNMVPELYKTPKSELEKIFPEYKAIEGFMVRSKAIECFKAYSQQKDWANNNVSIKEYEIEVKSQGIVVLVKFKYDKGIFGTSSTCQTLLDKTDLRCLPL